MGKKLPKEVEMNAKMIFERRKLIGWIFIAKDEKGEKIINQLMDGSIPGLEYCETKEIVPHAGGAGEYWIAFPKKQ